MRIKSNSLLNGDYSYLSNLRMYMMTEAMYRIYSIWHYSFHSLRGNRECGMCDTREEAGKMKENLGPLEITKG